MQTIFAETWMKEKIMLDPKDIYSFGNMMVEGPSFSSKDIRQVRAAITLYKMGVDINSNASIEEYLDADGFYDMEKIQEAFFEMFGEFGGMIIMGGGRASVNDIAKFFGWSRYTARKKATELIKAGILERVYGGTRGRFAVAMA